jgi:Pyocin activator protein PrtN
MITSLALMAIYKTPVIPLSEVCERYFSLSYEEALKKAARNELPVPAFRLTTSRKAPYVISAEALGDWIDKQEAAAKVLWQRSQI